MDDQNYFGQQEYNQWSGNCQFGSGPDVPPPLPQTLKTSFPELIGMNASQAMGKLVQMGLQPVTIYPGQPVTYDIDQNRVRLTVDKSGNVIPPVPMRG